jgi:3-methyladenine DNA glycosylase Mpg
MIDFPDKDPGGHDLVGNEPFGMAIYGPGGTDAYLYVCNVESNNVLDYRYCSACGGGNIQPNRRYIMYCDGARIFCFVAYNKGAP